MIGITITNLAKDPVCVVMRVPRWDWEPRLHRDVAILRLVRQYTSIPVPEAKYMDFTTNNPLESLYVIQGRVQGLNFQQFGHIFPSLSHEQQCTFAKAFSQILSSLHALEHPYPGLVEVVRVTVRTPLLSDHWRLNLSLALRRKLEQPIAKGTFPSLLFAPLDSNQSPRSSVLQKLQSTSNPPITFSWHNSAVGKPKICKLILQL